MSAKRLLIVDDDPAVLGFVSTVAQSLQYQVLTSSDGVEALLSFGDGDSINALITDVNMPGVNGFQLAHSLRAKRPDLPVLFISGYFEEMEAPRELIDAPGTHFLAKPFSPQTLGKALLLLFLAAGVS